MLAKMYSVSLLGMRGIPIEVEVNGGRGVPGLHIIGLANRAVAEAQLRIQTSIQNLGIRLKSVKTVINLAPADLKKEASHLDLAMCLALLAMQGIISPQPAQTAWLGELSLTGELKYIKNAMALCLALKQLGFRRVIIPAANQKDVSQISDFDILTAESLSQVMSMCQGHVCLPKLTNTIDKTPAEPAMYLDQIQGQEFAKRALIISAAGGHHLLMVGPPGVGKTLLAQALIDLLPPLAESEQLELQALYSLTNQPFNHCHRPFRSPHHTLTLTNALGTGQHISPGELALAHYGILFMDELLEFQRVVLEALRQPLESGQLNLHKDHQIYTFPAEFTLIAATNPCPCGYAGSGIKTCSCSLTEKRNYQQKLSGPLLDRIDLSVPVLPEASTLRHLLHHANTSSHMQLHQQQLQDQIIVARLIQSQRYGKNALNARVPFEKLWQHIVWQPEAKKLLDRACDQLQISPRALTKIIRIAQTLADLNNDDSISPQHVAESLQYRLSLTEMF